MMFTAPPEQTLEWSDEGVQGSSRFIRRLWKAVYEHVHAGAGAGARTASTRAACRAEARLRRIAHQTLAKVDR